MRNQIKFLFLFLSCAPALANDTSIQVYTTAKTNDSGSVSIKEVFTRGGQTNLVRYTSTKNSTVRIRIHRFYYAGSQIGEFVAMPDSSGFTTEAGAPYSVSFEFGATQAVKSAVIGTKDGIILDAFMATNGVFYPADISLMRKANDVGSDVKQLLSPKNVTNTSPEKFQQEVQDLIEKHKNDTNNFASPKN